MNLLEFIYTKNKIKTKPCLTAAGRTVTMAARHQVLVYTKLKVKF